MSDKIVVEEDLNQQALAGLREAVAQIALTYSLPLSRVDILTESTVDSGGDLTPCEIIIKPNSK